MFGTLILYDFSFPSAWKVRGLRLGYLLAIDYIESNISVFILLTHLWAQFLQKYIYVKKQTSVEQALQLTMKWYQ